MNMCVVMMDCQRNTNSKSPIGPPKFRLWCGINVFACSLCDMKMADAFIIPKDFVLNGFGSFIALFCIMGRCRQKF